MPACREPADQCSTPRATDKQLQKESVPTTKSCETKCRQTVCRLNQVRKVLFSVLHAWGHMHIFSVDIMSVYPTKIGAA